MNLAPNTNLAALRNALECSLPELSRPAWRIYRRATRPPATTTAAAAELGISVRGLQRLMVAIPPWPPAKQVTGRP